MAVQGRLLLQNCEIWISFKLNNTKIYIGYVKPKHIYSMDSFPEDKRKLETIIDRTQEMKMQDIGS